MPIHKTKQDAEKENNFTDEQTVNSEIAQLCSFYDTDHPLAGKDTNNKLKYKSNDQRSSFSSCRSNRTIHRILCYFSKYEWNDHQK